MLDRNAKVFLGCTFAFGVAAILVTASPRLPGDHRGYEPNQPIAFSHRLHAGEMLIDCKYCHFGVETSATAGIPPVQVCMNCHALVTSSKNTLDAEKLAAALEKREPRRVVSTEIAKLHRTFGRDEAVKPIPGAESRPILWERIHDLPDHVVFDHSVHVARGVDCKACHGPVDTMDRVRQFSALSMGWCIDCHRTNTKKGQGAVEPGSGHPRVEPHVTTDCTACHY